MAFNAKIQREGCVVYLVEQRMFHPTPELAGLGERDGFRLPSGRGDELAHGSLGSSDNRERLSIGVKTRDILIPTCIDTLKVKAWNFQ
ncbi:hypothetical protein J2Z75_005590 [Rhizobium herbae]|uniref:Uncharacterized protein n=1 Tax=Rhizobium herbae TaxID=508661 RepID=A0ABS4EVU1_9HYPH|nr:hypothetical protein [Rhizobium herbae]